MSILYARVGEEKEDCEDRGYVHWKWYTVALAFFALTGGIMFGYVIGDALADESTNTVVSTVAAPSVPPTTRPPTNPGDTYAPTVPSTNPPVNTPTPPPTEPPTDPPTHPPVVPVPTASGLAEATLIFGVLDSSTPGWNEAHTNHAQHNNQGDAEHFSYFLDYRYFLVGDDSASDWQTTSNMKEVGKVCKLQAPVPTDRVSEYTVDDTCANGYTALKISDADECWAAVCWLRNSGRLQNCITNEGNNYGACRSNAKMSNINHLGDDPGRGCMSSTGYGNAQRSKIFFDNYDNRGTETEVKRCPRYDAT